MRHTLSVVTIFNIVLKVSSSKCFLTGSTAVIFRQASTPYFLCEIAVFDSERSGTLNVVKVQLLGWP